MLGCERDRVTLLPYQPAWPSLFAEEAERLRLALGEHVLRVEHVGSTAVPGLDAKPILDIVVAVREARAKEEKAVEHLEAALAILEGTTKIE